MRALPRSKFLTQLPQSIRNIQIVRIRCSISDLTLTHVNSLLRLAQSRIQRSNQNSRSALIEGDPFAFDNAVQEITIFLIKGA